MAAPPSASKRLQQSLQQLAARVCRRCGPDVATARHRLVGALRWQESNEAFPHTSQALCVLRTPSTPFGVALLQAVKVLGTRQFQHLLAAAAVQDAPECDRRRSTVAPTTAAVAASALPPPSTPATPPRPLPPRRIRARKRDKVAPVAPVAPRRGRRIKRRARGASPASSSAPSLASSTTTTSASPPSPPPPSRCRRCTPRKRQPREAASSGHGRPAARDEPALPPPPHGAASLAWLAAFDEDSTAVNERAHQLADQERTRSATERPAWRQRERREALVEDAVRDAYRQGYAEALRHVYAEVCAEGPLSRHRAHEFWNGALGCPVPPSTTVLRHGTYHDLVAPDADARANGNDTVRRRPSDPRRCRGSSPPAGASFRATRDLENLAHAVAAKYGLRVL